jgi:preprotein translocase subunit SecA
MFNLKVRHNGDDNYNFKDIKECYKNNVDIIYGDASGFQFDILRHEYSDLNTRGNRKFSNTVAIVDEVDSMLIDDCSKIAMLAESMPGMNNLSILLVSIWQELNRIIQRFESTEDGLIYNRPIVNSDNENITFEKIRININDYLRIIKEELKHYVICKLLKHLDVNRENRIGVYAHFKDFIEKQADKWIDSAIDAKFIYKNEDQYLIKKDTKAISRITPIDCPNTGVIQNGTTWGDGLQQFLQIKEGLQLTAETLITNFLSNKAYFSRYGNKIYGLTGTLGSKSAKELLRDIYSIDFITFPRYKYRNFKE